MKQNFYGIAESQLKLNAVSRFLCRESMHLCEKTKW